MDNQNIKMAVKQWAEWLKLTNWEVIVLDEPPEVPKALLSIEPVEGRYIANLRVSNQFYDCAPLEKSNCIVHELLHLPQDKIRNNLRYITKNMSQDMKELAYDLITLELEYNTDWLAGVLSKSFPIPKSLKDGDCAEES